MTREDITQHELEIMLELLYEEIDGILNPTDYRRELQFLYNKILAQFLYNKILATLGIPKEGNHEL